LSNLAHGQRIRAKEFYEQSLAIKRKVLGLSHPSVASTLNNYAVLLLTMKEINGAKDAYEESLRIRTSVFGNNHPAVAESLNNIGENVISERVNVGERNSPTVLVLL
jgi:hypothetical protein